MADGELFAAMHDVGLAEFVAKGLDKKHRKPLPPLDVAGMTTAKAKVRDEFGAKKIFELSDRGEGRRRRLLHHRVGHGGVPGFDPVAPFPGPESSYATPRRATCLGIYGNLRTTSTTFSSCAGRLASLGESRHTAFFLDVCERGITNIERFKSNAVLEYSYFRVDLKRTIRL